MTVVRDISRDLVRHKISTSLRARIGLGCKFSVAQVAALTGIGASTIKGYLAGLAEPSLSQFIKLAAALGPVFASEITAVIDFDVIDANPECVGTVDLMAAAAAFVASASTSMRAPGRVTHTVDLEVHPFIEDMAQASQAWLSARSRVQFSRGGKAANSNEQRQSIRDRLREWNALRAWVEA